MTQREAKRQACLIAWKLLEAAMNGGVCLPEGDWSEKDAIRVEKAADELCQELYNRGSRAAAATIEDRK
jgi:hypothetical protein